MICYSNCPRVIIYIIILHVYLRLCHHVQATRSTGLEEPSLGQMRLWADEAAQRIACEFAVPEPETGGSIVLCTALHDRWVNAPTAILYNILVAWPYRRFVRFALFTSGTDKLALSHLVRHCEVALRHGLLRIASGGTAATHLEAASLATGPILDARNRGQAAPPRLEHWHASWHKNTSHVFGLHVAEAAPATQKGPQGSPFLVNLDVDNFMAPVFLERLAAGVFKPPTSVHTFLAPKHPHATAVCGRIGCFGEAFKALGGYDATEAAPSGYQDVDLRNRLRKNVMDHWPARAVELSGHGVLGGALSNDTTERVADRNSCKIAACSPLHLTKWHGQWCRMNEHNMQIMKGRLHEGLLVRNNGTIPFGWWVECCDWPAWSAGCEATAATPLAATVSPPLAPLKAKAAPAEASRRWPPRSRASAVEEAAPSTAKASAACAAAPAPPPTAQPDSLPPGPGAPTGPASEAVLRSEEVPAQTPLAGPPQLSQDVCAEATVQAVDKTSAAGAAATLATVAAPPPPEHAGAEAAPAPTQAASSQGTGCAASATEQRVQGPRSALTPATERLSRLHLVVFGFKNLVHKQPCPDTCPHSLHQRLENSLSH
jgi:hypothetical protein